MIYWKCTRGITVQPNVHTFLRFVLRPVISTSKYKKKSIKHYDGWQRNMHLKHSAILHIFHMVSIMFHAHIVIPNYSVKYIKSVSQWIYFITSYTPTTPYSNSKFISRQVVCIVSFEWQFQKSLWHIKVDHLNSSI